MQYFIAFFLICTTTFPILGMDDVYFRDSTRQAIIPVKYNSNIIFVPVIINGITYYWILDTGAGASAIDPFYASMFGLIPNTQDTTKAVGVNGTTKVFEVVVPQISIGNVEIKSLRAYSINFKSIIKEAIGIECVGILGYNFIKTIAVKIDYANQVVTFYKQGHFKYTGNGHQLNFKFVNNTPTVPIILDDSLKGLYFFDCGASNSAIYNQYASSNNLFARKMSSSGNMGVGGDGKGLRAKFKKASFAGFSIDAPIIDINTDPKDTHFNDTVYSGNAGNNLFRHFNIYLCYKDSYMIVEKGDNYSKSFLEDKSGIGLVLSDNNQYYVKRISSLSPAQKAGFEVGDTLQAINRIKVDYFNSIESIRNLFSSTNGEQLKIRIKRGTSNKELSLTLSDYL